MNKKIVLIIYYDNIKNIIFLHILGYNYFFHTCFIYFFVYFKRNKN